MSGRRGHAPSRTDRAGPGRGSCRRMVVAQWRRGRETGELGQRRINVDGFSQGHGRTVGHADAGSGEHEGDAISLFVVAVLGPGTVITEMPAVVTPQHDEGVFGEPELVEGVEDATYLGIHERK